MENLKEEYALADCIYEEYESLLWDMIEKTNPDQSLVKIANKLKEAKGWKDQTFFE